MNENTTRKLGGLLAIALAVAMVGAASGAWAAERFTDVPDSHPFYDEIALVEDACIAGGFPDGTYRPGQDVTRQAMAAFLTRAGSRVAIGNGSGVTNFGTGLGSSPSVDVATVTVSVPDLPGCSQQVVLTGSANVFHNDTVAASCDLSVTSVCNGYLAVREGASTKGETLIRLQTGTSAGGEVTAQAVVNAAPGDHTLNLAVRGSNVKTDKGLVTGGSIIAMVVPFGTGAAPASINPDDSAEVIAAETGQTP